MVLLSTIAELFFSSLRVEVDEFRDNMLLVQRVFEESVAECAGNEPCHKVCVERDVRTWENCVELWLWNDDGNARIYTLFQYDPRLLYAY